jgi:signal peptidase II
MKPDAALIKKIILLLLIALNTACDQWTKVEIRQEVAPYSRSEILGPYLVLTRVENTGAFLGLGSNWKPWAKRIFLQGLPLLLMGLLILRLLGKRTMDGLMVIGLGFILGGGLGNLWDRLYLGSVTDFLQISVAGFQTGIFNMADLSVTVGIALLLLAYLKDKPNPA